MPSWSDSGQLPVPSPTCPLPSLHRTHGWQWSLSLPQYPLPLCPLHPWLRTSLQ